jgi:ABC-2 type transport system permease protein
VSLLPRPIDHHAKCLRLLTLIRKEFRQVLRDPSSIALAIVLPVVMILLFGYGLSLDIKHVPVAVVLDDTGPEAMELARAFQGSTYFEAKLTPTYAEAERMVRDHEVDGVVRIAHDFGRQLMAGRAADVQVAVNAVDANRGRIMLGYAQGVVGQWQLKRAERSGVARVVAVGGTGQAVLTARTWFNPEGESRYFLVPGLLVLVMTLIGALMTALVMAREWERGTLESLFVTPARADEILLGKTVPYFLLGMIGLTLCLLASRLLFGVPFRGSVVILVGVSSLYLVVSLGIGLLISSATKSQFVASQMALVATFMPAFMLSGFIYDLRNVPAVVQWVSVIVPARYYVALLQTLFMAGNVWSVIVPNTLVLAVMAAGLMLLARAATRKRLA